MSGTAITNCHIHTFTLDHVPRNYPIRAVGWVRSRPWVIRAIAWMLRRVGARDMAEQVARLGRMAETGSAASQEAVLEQVLRQYSSGTRFVILPMDIGTPSGFDEPPVSLSEQHAQLNRLARMPKYAGLLLPFGTVHPDRPGAFDEFRRCVEDYGFRGLKLYPRLGFAPDHPVLMEQVFPYCVAHNLPVMSHCSKGGVHGREFKGEPGWQISAPHRYEPVLRAFPELRVCLAHFGGGEDWTDYIVKGIDPFDPEARRRNWLASILDMIRSGDYPNLYTDISYTLFEFESNFPFLRVFLENDAVRRAVLFGSDFYMTRQEHLSERAVSMRLRSGLGGELFRIIAQGNPARYLGETD